MMQSKIRLDAPVGVFDLRVYPEAGDPAVPLAAEMREPIAIARVVIAGEVAHISAALGAMSDAKAWANFDAAMRDMGVTSAHWERHKHGKILMKRRRIKTHG
ncbi:MAG: hypothetical protein JKX92_05420 [Porticoccaceae bacterium]|nr:hypothetical protein [Porticoccaceae bacterium]